VSVDRQTYRLVTVQRDGTQVSSMPDANLKKVRWTLNETDNELQYVVPTMAPCAAFAQTWIFETQLWLWNKATSQWVFKWCGPNWQIEGDQDSMTMDCEGVMSLFKKRIVDDFSILYTAEEQFDIAWGLLEFAQTGTNRDFHVGAYAWTPSGKTRSRNYPRNEHQKIFELMEEWPTLDGGFDYAIQLNSDGSRVWRPYYPSKGVVRTDVALRWGTNINGFKYSESSTEQANQVYVTGATSGDVKFEQNYEDTGSSAIYGVMQEVVADSAQKSVAWLLDRAKQEVADLAYPVTNVEITAVRVPDDLLFKLEVGDMVLVSIQRGRISVHDMYRIWAIEWDPEKNELSLEVVKVP
jgi:hypothetical protein